MADPKIPLTNNIVADTSGTVIDTSGSASPGTSSTGNASGGDMGSSLGGMGGEALGAKIGGEQGAAIGSAVGKAVGGAVLGSVLGGGAGSALGKDYKNMTLMEDNYGPAPGGLANGAGDYYPTSGDAVPGGGSGAGGSGGGGGGGGGSRPPDANSVWFTFKASSGGFSVYSFSGYEEACKPYEFSVELVHQSSSVDINGLTGTPASLSISDRSGEKRLVHGIIREMKQLHTANRFTHYRAIIVPKIWFLGQTRDHRIFQNLTVVDIIQKLLKEQGFAGEESSFKVGQKLEPREYCVQYGETTLHFIQRLCEEEGIFFYFKHKEDSHCVCFFDYSGGPAIAGKPDIRFYPGSGQPADTAVISRLEMSHRVNSNASVYKEWNFTTPKVDLTVQEQETDPKKAPGPDGMLLEEYNYPHIYDKKELGTRYVKLQVERQLTFAQWIDCQSDVSRFLPGHTFSINQHPRKDINASWWVFSVVHEGEQPGVLEHEAPSGRGLHYLSRVTAIPDKTRFVPALEHPKKRVVGTQTAIVTGPKGEEIFPDKYGRVKVQFFWDREGKWDDKTTCWIRVSQGWAGPQYGMIAIPRIGHEVIVSFLEGDPDRPLVTGRVYHDINMPPYQLPENKTRTVFKSMSTPGGENEQRGFNELRIEDKKGEEEVYFHAEKDVNVYVKNDWKEHILHDKHRTVDNFRFTHIKGEEQVLIEKPRKQELKEEDYLTVHKDSHTEYKTKWLAKAGEEIHLKSGSKVVMEAGADFTIKAGGAFIRLNPSGVTIVGAKIRLNAGGSPDNGSGVSMELPDESVKTDAGTMPKSQVLALKQAARTGKPFCAKCQ